MSACMELKVNDFGISLPFYVIQHLQESLDNSLLRYKIVTFEHLSTGTLCEKSDAPCITVKFCFNSFVSVDLLHVLVIQHELLAIKGLLMHIIQQNCVSTI